MSKKLIEIRVATKIAEKWTQKITDETKWHPREGIFEDSSSAIASYLKANSKDLKQAMSRLNFYINRAGKNLSSSDQSRLERAKNSLSRLYK